MSCPSNPKAITATRRRRARRRQRHRLVAAAVAVAALAFSSLPPPSPSSPNPSPTSSLPLRFFPRVSSYMYLRAVLTRPPSDALSLRCFHFFHNSLFALLFSFIFFFVRLLFPTCSASFFLFFLLLCLFATIFSHPPHFLSFFSFFLFLSVVGFLISPPPPPSSLSGAGRPALCSFCISPIPRPAFIQPTRRRRDAKLFLCFLSLSLSLSSSDLFVCALL